MSCSVILTGWAMARSRSSWRRRWRRFAVTPTAWITDEGIDTDDRLAGATPYLRLFATALGGFLLARAARNRADANARAAREASALFYVQHILPPATALQRSRNRGPEWRRTQADRHRPLCTKNVLIRKLRLTSLPD